MSAQTTCPTSLVQQALTHRLTCPDNLIYLPTQAGANLHTDMPKQPAPTFYTTAGADFQTDLGSMELQ